MDFHRDNILLAVSMGWFIVDLEDDFLILRFVKPIVTKAEREELCFGNQLCLVSLTFPSHLGKKMNFTYAFLNLFQISDAYIIEGSTAVTRRFGSIHNGYEVELRRIPT